MDSLIQFTIRKREQQLPTADEVARHPEQNQQEYTSQEGQLTTEEGIVQPGLSWWKTHKIK